MWRTSAAAPTKLAVSAEQLVSGGYQRWMYAHLRHCRRLRCADQERLLLQSLQAGAAARAAAVAGWQSSRQTAAASAGHPCRLRSQPATAQATACAPARHEEQKKGLVQCPCNRALAVHTGQPTQCFHADDDCSALMPCASKFMMAASPWCQQRCTAFGQPRQAYWGGGPSD